MDGTVRTFRFLFVGKRNMGILYLRRIMQWILVRHRLSGAINFEWKLAETDPQNNLDVSWHYSVDYPQNLGTGLFRQLTWIPGHCS